MPPALAPRRLRSPQEAFALCQRPLPAHLYPRSEQPLRADFRPDAGGRPPVRPPVFAERRMPAFAGAVLSATAGRWSTSAAGSTTAVAAPMRTQANARPRSATAGLNGPNGSPSTAAGPSRGLRATGSAASLFGGSAPRTQSKKLSTGRRPSATFESHGSAALAPQPAVDRRSTSTPTSPTSGGARRPADLRVVPSRLTGAGVAGAKNRSDGAAKPAREARPVRSAVWKRRLRALGAFSLFGLALTVSFSAIAMHSQLAGRQMKLTTLRVDVDAAEREHQMLRLKVAELDTPEQVVSAAYNLGLTGALEVEFLPTASTIPAVATAGPVVPDRS